MTHVIIAGGPEEDFEIGRVRPDSPVYASIRRWSARIDAAIAESRASHIVIDPMFEGDSASLRGLARFAGQIEYLMVPSKPKLGLEFISELTGLRELWLDQLTDAPSFAGLVHLEKVYLHKPVGTLGRLWEAPALAELHLWSIPLRSMEALTAFPALRRLTLRQVDTLGTLDGIQSLRLKVCEFVNNRRLKSVASLRGMPSLEIFRLSGSGGITDLAAAGDWPQLQTFAVSSGPPIANFDLLEASRGLRSFLINSTNMVGVPCSIAPFTRMRQLTSFILRAGPTKGFQCLRDLDRLGEITSLEQLGIDRGPDLPSIAFLRGLTHLNSLRLTRTNILDGDLSPVLALPHLATLEISPHLKHYSHRFPN